MAPGAGFTKQVESLDSPMTRFLVSNGETYYVGMAEAALTQINRSEKTGKIRIH